MYKLLSFLFLLAITSVVFSNTTQDTLKVTKGKLLPNHTYLVKSMVEIAAGDTLYVMPGDSLIMLPDPTTKAAGWIHVLGSFVCEGTASSRIVITSQKQVPPDNTYPGYPAKSFFPGLWGGIIADSAKLVSIKFTNISWAGGNDASGHAYRTVQVTSDYAYTTKTVFTDNYVVGSVDDCIGIFGGSASVLRNVVKYCGYPDGDNFNIKSGTIGEIAYNIVWASGGNGIKINASTSNPRLTNMCVHNNTIVAGGWRRVEELGYAVLVDKSARAQIYNNIFGDMYQELEITPAADTNRTVYANNLFFYSVDSLNAAHNRYYPLDGIGRKQANDKWDIKAADLFRSYNPYFNNNYFNLDGTNNYQILATSVAATGGFTPPAPSQTNYWNNPYFVNGTAPTQLPGATFMGALSPTATAVEELNTSLPAKFELSQNYPNPFNPTTQISYSIPESGNVSMRVYDVLGRQVAELVNGSQNAGRYTVNFNASRLSSGIYFYTIQSGSFTQTKKMMLMK